MTTMSVRTFLNVSTKLPVETSVLLRGNHGIGKSQVVRQVAKHFGLEVIDRRLSQMSEGDMVGLPSTDGEVTRFNPPDWYKNACKKPVALFLDELNRATPEVMQAAFQVVLDRELNGWKLHPQTRVYAAINASSAYTVNEMDPALLDRFWAIDLTPDTADWLAWAKESNSIHDNIVQFIAGNEKWLDPPKNVEATQVSPSRRSWERLSKALVGAGVAETPDDALFYPMCLGYVGTEATIAFHGFVKTIDAQVTGEEIVNEYSRVKSKIARLGQEKLNVAIEKVADYVTKNLTTLNDVQGANLRDFMAQLPAELRVAAWSKLTAGGVEKLDLAKSVHKWCVTSILEVFGVSKEDANKGNVPDVPGINPGSGGTPELKSSKRKK
jgi:hypothetical protein